MKNKVMLCASEKERYMVKKGFTINITKDTDAKLIAGIAQKAERFESVMYLEFDKKRANVKSIMGMMSLPIKNGAEVAIMAEGADEAEAVRFVMEAFGAGKEV